MKFKPGTLVKSLPTDDNFMEEKYGLGVIVEHMYTSRPNVSQNHPHFALTNGEVYNIYWTNLSEFRTCHDRYIEEITNE